MIKLPFEVPDRCIVELSKDKIPKYKGWRYGRRFKPFIDQTAITCEKYDNGYYLFVLDFDYDNKWDNPVYKEFKNKYDTYTRETKHGLHMFYFSPFPCDIIQSKKNITVDLRRLTSIGEDNNKRGNYIVLYDLPTNKLPVKCIDCNILIEELYKMNDEPVRHYGDSLIYSKTNVTGNYILTNPNITDRHRAIAHYLKNHESNWHENVYYMGWHWGLKLGGVLKDEIEAEAVATALMNIVPYNKKQAWVINFMNGYNHSYRVGYGLGDIKLKWGVLSLMIQEIKDEGLDNKELIPLLARELKDLKTLQYIEVVNEVVK